MVTAFLLLGSNLGDREGYLDKARKQIRQEAVTLLKVSSIYETAAWGTHAQPDFLNQVIVIETKLTAEHLLRTVQQIESSLGRQRSEKWGARTIDIDILFHGDQIIESPELVIPHPAIPRRRFTLIPLAEIIPAFVHPVLNKTIEKLLVECNDPLTVNLFKHPDGLL